MNTNVKVIGLTRLGIKPESTAQETDAPYYSAIDSNCIRGLNIEKEQPYHPNASSLPKQYLPGRTLAFQDSWFSAFPWLH